MIKLIAVAVVAASLAACGPIPEKAPTGARFHAQDREACARQPDMPWCSE